jgi:hypothetical protein
MNEDINNYLLNDLLKVFEIEDYDKLTKNKFIKIANNLIKRTEKKDPELENFLQRAKNRILNEFDIITKNENLNVYNQDIKSDVINPKYELFTSRILCVDSEYRPSTELYTSKLNTEFTITLSETIKNVISMKLYSIQIPKTWYNIDSEIGNNSLKIDSSLIEIDSGNYTIDELITELNQKTNQYNISFNYNTITKKITIENNSSQDAKKVTFYDKNIISSKCNTPASSNFNLGWNLGFRESLDSSNSQIITIEKNQSKTGQAIASLYNLKYCLLVVDDFNKNHVNKNLINAVGNEAKLSIPEYRNLESCIKDENTNDVLYIASNPRRLTQAQLYSINSIIEDRKSSIHNTVAPTSNNIMALIPINSNSQESNIIEYGEGLSLNKRNYFGPVDIEKIHVKLLNEKGKLINLNGVDWSFTIHLEQLYNKNI